MKISQDTKIFFRRVLRIVIYGIVYSIFWKLTGLGFTIIVMGATIIAGLDEIYLMNKYNKGDMV